MWVSLTEQASRTNRTPGGGRTEDVDEGLISGGLGVQSRSFHVRPKVFWVSSVKDGNIDSRVLNHCLSVEIYHIHYLTAIVRFVDLTFAFLPSSSCEIGNE